MRNGCLPELRLMGFELKFASSYCSLIILNFHVQLRQVNLGRTKTCIYSRTSTLVLLTLRFIVGQERADGISRSELVGTLSVVRDRSIRDSGAWLAELLHGCSSHLLWFLSHVSRATWGQTADCPLHVVIISLSGLEFMLFILLLLNGLLLESR
jgi:hypothetical protein